VEVEEEGAVLSVTKMLLFWFSLLEEEGRVHRFLPISMSQRTTPDEM
jgi:hypothetical protein